MIYRVTRKFTESLQPKNTFWEETTLYCGENVTEARIAYHKHGPKNTQQGYGNRCVETTFEQLKEEDLPDDDPGKMILLQEE